MGDNSFEISLPEKLGKKLSIDFLLNEEFFEFVSDLIVYKCLLKVVVCVEKKQSFWNCKIDVKGELQTCCDRCGDPLEMNIKGGDTFFVKRQERNKNDQHENMFFISSKKSHFDIKSMLQEVCFFVLPLTRKHDMKDCNQLSMSYLQELNKVSNGQTISSSALKSLKKKLNK